MSMSDNDGAPPGAGLARVSFHETPTMYIHETLLPLADEDEFCYDPEDDEDMVSAGAGADCEGGNKSFPVAYGNDDALASVDEELAIPSSSASQGRTTRRATSMTMASSLDGLDFSVDTNDVPMTSISITRSHSMVAENIALKSVENAASAPASAAAVDAVPSAIDDGGSHGPENSGDTKPRKSLLRSSLIRSRNNIISEPSLPTVTASMTHGASNSGAAPSSPRSILSRVRRRFGKNRYDQPGTTRDSHSHHHTEIPRHRLLSSEQPKSRTRTLVLRTKVAFFLFLLIVAAVTSILLHSWLARTEVTFAKAQFQSLARRAVQDSADVVSRKRLSMATMGVVIGEQFRDAERDWPNVAVAGYERIVEMLARTGSHVS